MANSTLKASAEDLILGAEEFNTEKAEIKLLFGVLAPMLGSIAEKAAGKDAGPPVEVFSIASQDGTCIIMSAHKTTWGSSGLDLFLEQKGGRKNTLVSKRSGDNEVHVWSNGLDKRNVAIVFQLLQPLVDKVLELMSDDWNEEVGLYLDAAKRARQRATT